MLIADPARIKVHVGLAVEDSIALENGAEIRLFLDADPLNPLRARIEHASYHAEPLPDGRLAYRVHAGPESGAAARIGLRGTAQLFSEDVPLYFFLLRRPIAAVPQALGV